MGSLTFANISDRQWQIKATMSNSVLLRCVLTVKDVAKKIKADKIKGIVRTRSLRPIDPWIMDLAMAEVKGFVKIYSAKLVSMNIETETIK